jgi:hypothetical protein
MNKGPLPLRKISVERKFWPSQIFSWKKILELKIFNFNNNIFGKFFVRGNFSLVEMALEGLP